MPHTSVAHDHPKQRLLFFIAQESDDHIRAGVRGLVTGLASRRRWLNGPPRFVDVAEAPEDLSGEDMPIETLGGYIEIYSTWPPWTLPRDVDLQHLEEVTDLVSALCDFSRQHQLVFELELDSDPVGEIANGVVDRSLAVGLLGEWWRRLGTSG